MTVFAKAPCRVDIAGGTIDIWPLYLFHTGAVTVNFAVDRYASCRLATRKDRKIILRSRDLGGEEIFPDHLKDNLDKKEDILKLADLFYDKFSNTKFSAS